MNIPLLAEMAARAYREDEEVSGVTLQGKSLWIQLHDGASYRVDFTEIRKPFWETA